MSRSSSLDREVKGYLTPGLFIKVNTYVEEHKVSKSSVINDALALFFKEKKPAASAFQTNEKRRDHNPE